MVNIDEGKKRKKVSYVGVPAIFKLQLACKQLNEAYGDFGCYHVGSSLERADWRDVDIILIMDDADFRREFPGAGPAMKHYEHDLKWLINSIAISGWLSELAGVPVDFKIQPKSIANEQHKGLRSALGMNFSFKDDV